MTIAALVVFAVLLISWLVVPADLRRRAEPARQPIPELVAEAA